MGLGPERIMLAEDGTVVDLVDGLASIVGTIRVGYVYVDGLEVGDVSDSTLTDRQILGDSGFITILVAVDMEAGKVVYGPEIVARGFSDDPDAFAPIEADLVAAVEQAAIDLADRSFEHLSAVAHAALVAPNASFPDINAAMLAVGRDRALARGEVEGISLLVADAERLPLPDRSFDRVSIAFGLRNCTDKPAVLAEARRVLKPGGRFLCLEFSRVQVAALAPLYDAWSFGVLPRLGQAVAGDAESYRYLAESIRTFPDQDALAAMMRGAGLARVNHRNLTGGIAAIHAGWRL